MHDPLSFEFYSLLVESKIHLASDDQIKQILIHNEADSGVT